MLKTELNLEVVPESENSSHAKKFKNRAAEMAEQIESQLNQLRGATKKFFDSFFAQLNLEGFVITTVAEAVDYKYFYAIPGELSESEPRFSINAWNRNKKRIMLCTITAKGYVRISIKEVKNEILFNYMVTCQSSDDSNEKADLRLIENPLQSLDLGDVFSLDSGSGRSELITPRSSALEIEEIVKKTREFLNRA